MWVSRAMDSLFARVFVTENHAHVLLYSWSGFPGRWPGRVDEPHSGRRREGGAADAGPRGPTEAGHVAWERVEVWSVPPVGSPNPLRAPVGMRPGRVRSLSRAIARLAPITSVHSLTMGLIRTPSSAAVPQTGPQGGTRPFTTRAAGGTRSTVVRTHSAARDPPCSIARQASRRRGPRRVRPHPGPREVREPRECRHVERNLGRRESQYTTTTTTMMACVGERL